MTTNDHTPSANSIFNIDFEFGIFAGYFHTDCFFVVVAIFSRLLVVLPLLSKYKLQLKCRRKNKTELRKKNIYLNTHTFYYFKLQMTS